MFEKLTGRNIKKIIIKIFPEEGGDIGVSFHVCFESFSKINNILRIVFDSWNSLSVGLWGIGDHLFPFSYFPSIYCLSFLPVFIKCLSSTDIYQTW